MPSTRKHRLADTDPFPSQLYAGGSRARFIPVSSVLILLVACVLTGQAFGADLPAGKVVWWGRDSFWKNYYLHRTNSVLDNDDEMVTNAVAISAHGDGGSVLLKNGTVLAIGRFFPPEAKPPAGLSNITTVAITGNSSWAFGPGGTLQRWGSDQDDANVVAGLSNITAIAWAGYRSYLALKDDGTVLGFDLANNPSTARLVEVDGHTLRDVKGIAPSGDTPIIVKTDGSVFQLEYQGSGAPPVQPRYESRGNILYIDSGAESAQLPYRYTSADPVIVQGTALSNVVSLAGGEGHVLALKRDGSVVEWNIGSKDPATVPTGVSNVIAIAAGGNDSMALKRDGTVVAWGNNSEGQTSVPAGLSNVVAIATSGSFSLAITTGAIPSSVCIAPHGRLEELEQKADLIFKGEALASTQITNAAFRIAADVQATQFKIISVLKGAPATNIITFQHYSSMPRGGWSGPHWPANYVFDTGRCYLVYAANMDKSDAYYTPSPGLVATADLFRQIADIPKGDQDGFLRVLDSRPLAGLSAKAAHWFELDLLLHDANASNLLYAIDKFDSMSLPGRSHDEWLHSPDFRRHDVLTRLLPLVTNENEQVAIRAIDCYEVESNASARLEPFAVALIGLANDGRSASVRVRAIAALSGTHFEAVSNSLAQLLRSTDEKVRASAVGLLVRFPGGFRRQALRRAGGDSSAQVRASVADVIGRGKIESLLPVLVKLFSDPVGFKEPLPPLTLEDLEAGGRADISGDVHTSAGFAFLEFDTKQVGDILKTNLTDAGFRLPFLCKLAEDDPKPWINDMVGIMEARRVRSIRKAEAQGTPPGTYMYLSGAHYTCWKIIYGYLRGLPPEEFAGGKMDRCLDMLENAGVTGSQEPTSLYELYRMKGLNERAARYRQQCEKTSGYDIGYYFTRIDNQLTNSPPAK